MFLTKDDQLRLDIVQLKEEYENLSMSGLGKNETEQQQNVEQLDSSSVLTSETSEILRFNLRSIFHTLEVEPPSSDESSFSKQVLELKNHDKTYDFTFLPNEIVENMLEKEKKTYFEQVSKVQYDLLKQQQHLGLFRPEGTLTITNTSQGLSSRYVFQHLPKPQQGADSERTYRKRGFKIVGNTGSFLRFTMQFVW